mgnify:FL=1
MPDPSAIGSFEWSELGKLLHNLWFYLALIVVFAFTMLTALAIIPSLVSTRQLPAAASHFSFTLALTALAFLGLGITLMIYTENVARVLGRIYDRWWI